MLCVILVYRIRYGWQYHSCSWFHVRYVSLRWWTNQGGNTYIHWRSEFRNYFDEYKMYFHLSDFINTKCQLLLFILWFIIGIAMVIINLNQSSCIVNSLKIIVSMAEWLRAWDTLATRKLWRREVVSSIPDRGNIVGWVFSPTRQLVRFSHLNMPFFLNYKFIWNIVPLGKQ